MTNVFQPSVFQPDVFQVGTLDVVIPDAPTKRRKWLSISVPGAGQASGIPAFAVSRDSAGILIGVRDNAAPQFAVSKDSGGLLLSAWPSAPPLPTSYVASAYVLGLGQVAHGIRFCVRYWDAAFQILGTHYITVMTSLSEWQRVSHTYPVPETAAYVSVRIESPRDSPSGAYWTALKVEAGTNPTPYGGGGANLLLNPEFATDLSYWTQGGEMAGQPLAKTYSRATSLPSSPLPGVTTALAYVSDGYEPSVYYNATHRQIALPTP